MAVGRTLARHADFAQLCGDHDQDGENYYPGKFTESISNIRSREHRCIVRVTMETRTCQSYFLCQIAGPLSPLDVLQFSAVAMPMVNRSAHLTFPTVSP